MIKIIAVGNPVQHRAWHWIGKVAEDPGDTSSHSTVIKVELPSGSIQSYALFSLIINEEDFVYDWSEFYETSRRRAKSKVKKPRH